MHETGRYAWASIVAMIAAALVFAVIVVSPGTAYAETEDTVFTTEEAIVEEDTTDPGLTQTLDTEKEYASNVKQLSSSDTEAVKGEDTNTEEIKLQVTEEEEVDAVEQPLLTTASVKSVAQAAPETVSAKPDTAKTDEASKTITVQEVSAPAPSPTVATGLWNNQVFYIESVKNLGLVLDMSGNSKKAGGNAIVWNYNGGKNQQWKLVWDAAQNAYLIYNVGSNLVLDISGGNAKNCANVIQWGKKNADYQNQLWVITGDDASGYVVASKKNQNFVLDIQGGKGKNGDNVEVYKTQKASGAQVAWQRWHFLTTNPTVNAQETLAPGVYTIARADTPNELVDVEGISQNNGANIDLWQANAGLNQKWVVQLDANSKLYTLISVASGKALATTGMVATANVVQANQASSNAQKWSIEATGSKNSQGKAIYRIVSKMSGMALAAQGNGKTNGTNIYTYFANGGAYEQFVFSETPLLDDGIYSLAMRSNTNQVLDVPNNTTVANTQLELWSYNTGLNQKFQLTKVGTEGKNDVYTLQSGISGQFVTASASGSKVVQASQDNSLSQRWVATWSGAGVVLTNQQTGQRLHSAGTAVNKGALMEDSAPANAAVQTFAFQKRNLIENGAYTLKTAVGSRLLDVTGASKADNANIIIWQSNGGSNQKFTITHVSGGYYKLVNVESGKVVATSGSNVVQTTYSGAATQLWQADISPVGGIIFINRQTGRALDVSGGKDANGINVDVAAVNKTAAAQRWTLDPTATLTAAQQDALNRINARNSNTNYAISVNLSTHWVWVFERASKSSPWKLKFEWRCSNGARDTPTPAVNRLSSGYKRYQSPELNPEGVPYASSFYYMTYVDSGKYFHSILYKKGSTTQVKDGRLGKSISNGCIRLETQNAIWIYNNIKKDTRIITYY